jgi:Effector protein
MIRIPQWNITIAYAFSEAARSGAAKTYEDRVRLAVNAVMRTQTGKALVQSFRTGLTKDASIWIVPYTDMNDYCNSRTGPLYSTDVKTGKQWTYEGVRIQYSPDRWAMDDCGWYPGQRPEEVLCHEMVHASRNLNDAAYDDTPLDLMGDYEEFLAVLITNMFRSEMGAKKFHRDYVYKLLVDQQEAELFLSSKSQYITALKSLLDDQLVAAVTGVNTAFNPFRDFDRLEAAYGDIREILESINPLAGLRETERLKAIGKKLQEQQQMSVDSSSRVMQRQ